MSKEHSMQYVNLSPHTLNMTDGDIPPSGLVARIEEMPGDEPDTIRMGKIIGLPGPVEGIRYVVARPLAMIMALTGEARDDVFVVGQLLRNEEGVITGAHGFARFI